MDALLDAMPSRLLTEWSAFLDLDSDAQEAARMEADVRARAAR